MDFRNAVRGYDGFLLVTPEHNRSFPAAMKNAMDTGSRPYGQNAWDGKPAAIISVTTGTLGAFGANHHLRQMLTYLNMPAVQQPEVYISRVKERLSPEGALPEDTRALIRSLLEALAQLVEGQPSKPPEEQG